MTHLEEEKLISDLKKFDNVGDIMNYLSSRYNLKTAKLGMLTKPEYIKGVVKAIKTLKPEKI